jgi:hypothetical protein
MKCQRARLYSAYTAARGIRCCSMARRSRMPLSSIWCRVTTAGPTRLKTWRSPACAVTAKRASATMPDRGWMRVCKLSLPSCSHGGQSACARRYPAWSCPRYRSRGRSLPARLTDLVLAVKPSDRTDSRPWSSSCQAAEADGRPRSPIFVAGVWGLVSLLLLEKRLGAVHRRHRVRCLNLPPAQRRPPWSSQQQ